MRMKKKGKSSATPKAPEPKATVPAPAKANSPSVATPTAPSTPVASAAAAPLKAPTAPAATPAKTDAPKAAAPAAPKAATPAAPPKKRGRPPKAAKTAKAANAAKTAVKRGPGRPRKDASAKATIKKAATKKTAKKTTAKRIAKAPKSEKPTFDGIIADLKQKAAGFDASGYHDFLAIQVTLKDMKKVFYVEVKDGRLSIEPYEYYDRQAHIIISSANFVKMINGKLNSVLALTTGRLKIEGDIGRAQELSRLLGK